MVVVLAGGVGAARFLRGLVRIVPPEDVVVVSNTGDDARIYGLHVSPDVDIVTFTLAGQIDDERGWGLLGDKHTVLGELRAAGVEPWFTLGDRDLALSLARTIWLDQGIPLSETAARIAARFGVRTAILPMTDDRVETRLLVVDAAGMQRDVHFQEYWVAGRAADEVLAVRLEGAEFARPGPGVIEAIDAATAVIVAPSNPVVSIGTILSVPGIREALRDTASPVVAVSPIVGGSVLRGMADRLMPVVGAEVSAAGVATLYRDFADGIVVDVADASLAETIERAGVAVTATPAIMRSAEDAEALAKTTLAFAEHLRGTAR